MESPIILPPESISKSVITRDTFALSKSFAVTLQLSSNNVRVVTTEVENEDGTIATTVTTEPDTGKELAFGIFLTDEDSAYTFGASAGRCGWTDYSTKGEVGEGIKTLNGEKFQINYGSHQNIDFLLDHVYPENEQFLVKNQTPDVKSVFSMLFVTHKEFFNSVIDKYGNSYYDKIAIDSNGNVIDFLTGETRPLAEYNSPVLIQYKTTTGKNKCFIFDFEFEGKPVNIINMNYLTLKILFENHGGTLILEIMKPGENFFRHCITKDLGYNFYGNNNIRFGFSHFTPLFSYDKNKIANFTCHTIQMQQSDEKPDWLKSLIKELKSILGATKFNVELTEKNIILPAALTQVDYIENYTTALIISDIILNSEYSISAEYESTAEATYAMLFGSSNNSNPGYRIWSMHGSGEHVGIDYGSETKSASTDLSTIGKRIKVTSNKNKVTFDIPSEDNQVVITLPEQTFECPSVTNIFAATSDGAYPASAKLYSLSGSINGIKQFNYIPVISNSGRPGLYDTISKRPIYCTNFDASISRDFLWGGNKSGSWFNLLSSALVHCFGSNNVGLVIDDDDSKVAAIMPDLSNSAQITHAKLLLDRVVPKKYATETRWKENIPTEYIPIEYLEGTGTQYIETIGDFTSDHGISAVYSHDPDLRKIWRPLGTKGKYNGKDLWVITPRWAKDANYWEAFWGSQINCGTPSPIFPIDIKLGWLGEKKLSITNANNETKTYNLNDISFSLPPLNIFGKEGGPAPTPCFEGKIYRAKISLFDSIVQDWTPVFDTSTGQPGMYDIINRIFKPNDGSGNFIVGINTWLQLTKLLSNLPDRTNQTVGTIMIRLAPELQTEANKTAIQELINNKNWEIAESD